MSASISEDELNTTSGYHLEINQELAAAKHPGEDVKISDQKVDAESSFDCPHCDKSYTTKKSLSRHLSNTDNPCAKQRHVQAPSKLRWACSRCGKDCATIHSVERHIKASCWRNCDECVADEANRCDSTTKTGPCRTCEAKEQSCTKHTSPIAGTKPQAWTGPAARPEQGSPDREEPPAVPKRKSTKRKTPASPKISPRETQKNKLKTSAEQIANDYGLGRMYDPLGGEAYVPKVVKEAAVSDWLQGQSNKSSLIAAAQDHAPHYSLLLTQPRLVQRQQVCSSPVQLLDLSRVPGRTLPSPANFYTSHHCNVGATAGYGPNVSLPQQFHTHQITGCRSSISTPSSNIPNLSLTGAQPSISSQTTQLDRLFLQMQATRQQNEAHDIDMKRRSGPRNNMTLPPPIEPSDSRKLKHQEIARSQGGHNMLPVQRLTYGNVSHNDSMLTLRIHSNTSDKNGQPIFSILRIGRNEPFGPRLDAYCSTRGKEFGVHWSFVYRCQANLGQEMIITLIWDMTPNDVKDADAPGLTMQNLDTIYVMQAQSSTSVKNECDLDEGAAVQSPDLQVPLQLVDITNGETNAYQNPDVSRQWYQAIEQDSARLRASAAQMNSTIIQQQQQIFAKNQFAARQQAVIEQLTNLSKQVRERFQNPLPDPAPRFLPPPASHAPSALQAPAARVVRQRPGPPAAAQQPAQPRSKANPTAFVAKCEAVRDPQDHTQQHLEPLQFPSFTSEYHVSDHTQQSSMHGAYNTQVQTCGRIHDAADNVAAENGGDEMNEE